MADVAELLQTAVRLHRGGQLDDAREIYERIVQQDPRHANALNLLGLVGWQTGRFAEAVEHLRQAIAIDDSQAAYFGNLAEAQRGLGQVNEAIESYAKAQGIKIITHGSATGFTTATVVLFDLAAAALVVAR